MIESKRISKNQNKVLSGLMGLCVGDALGVPVESRSRRFLKRYPVKGMQENGTHNKPAGTWSDDSSLTFCTSESLCNGLDLDDMAQRFLKWYKEGYCTPYGSAFDAGSITMYALEKINAGRKAEFCGAADIRSNGNGSLMRILPLAFYLENYNGDKFKVVEKVSAITHAHIYSKISCNIYIEFAINLLKGLKPEEAYEKMQNAILDYYSDKVPVECITRFNRILKRKIYKEWKFNIFSDGYVIHSLEACLWSFINSHDYSSAVLKAVNLGGVQILKEQSLEDWQEYIMAMTIFLKNG